MEKQSMDCKTIILNPTAGNGRARLFKEKIETYLDQRNIPYHLVTTEYEGHATELARKAADVSREIIAVGGDGTVLEVTKGLIGKEVALGIISAGTGNDTIKGLGISSDFTEAMEAIVGGKTKLVDMATIDGQYFLNLSSVGLDAHINQLTHSIKKKVPSKFAYAMGVLAGLITYSDATIQVKSDHLEYRGKSILCAIGNGGYYGGGFNILPMAKMDDGVLNLCLVKKVSKIRLIYLLSKLLKKEHMKYKDEILFDQTKQVVISSDHPICVNVDGEVMEKTGDITVKIVEHALQIIN